MMPTSQVCDIDERYGEQKLKLSIGAMVLGHSLKDKGAKGKLVVLATLENLSGDSITELKVAPTYLLLCLETNYRRLSTTT